MAHTTLQKETVETMNANFIYPHWDGVSVKVRDTDTELHWFLEHFVNFLANGA